MTNFPSLSLCPASRLIQPKSTSYYHFANQTDRLHSLDRLCAAIHRPHKLSSIQFLRDCAAASLFARIHSANRPANNHCAHSAPINKRNKPQRRSPVARIAHRSHVCTSFLSQHSVRATTISFSPTQSSSRRSRVQIVFKVKESIFRWFFFPHLKFNAIHLVGAVVVIIAFVAATNYFLQMCIIVNRAIALRKLTATKLNFE